MIRISDVFLSDEFARLLASALAAHRSGFRLLGLGLLYRALGALDRMEAEPNDEMWKLRRVAGLMGITLNDGGDE